MTSTRVAPNECVLVSVLMVASSLTMNIIGLEYLPYTFHSMDKNKRAENYARQIFPSFLCYFASIRKTDILGHRT